jgi:hypothetical protein
VFFASLFVLCLITTLLVGGHFYIRSYQHRVYTLPELLKMTDRALQDSPLQRHLHQVERGIKVTNEQITCLYEYEGDVERVLVSLEQYPKTWGILYYRGELGSWVVDGRTLERDLKRLGFQDRLLAAQLLREVRIASNN